MNPELLLKFKQLANLAESLVFIAENMNENITNPMIELYGQTPHQEEYWQVFKEIFAEVYKEPIDKLNVDDLAEDLLLKAVFDYPRAYSFRDFFLKRALTFFGFESQFSLFKNNQHTSFFSVSSESVSINLSGDKVSGICHIM